MATALITVLGFSVAGLTTAPSAAACSSSGTPVVATDEQDYEPGETVTITGSGFACDQALTVRVSEPDGDAVDAAVTADAATGAFTTSYAIPSVDAGGQYGVDVVDAGGAVLATTTFYDSHFRFGHISWTRPSASSPTVTFALQNAFRRSGYGCVNPTTGGGVPCTGPGGRPGPGDSIVETIGGTALQFGDGSSTNTLRYQVDAIDVAGDWLLATALHPGTATRGITKTYASLSAFTARINSSARTGSERNNPGGNYRVETLVQLGSTSLDSPRTSLPAVVDCALATTCAFPIPVSDGTAGNAVSFRLSTFAEWLGNQPAGATVTPSGTYSWNTPAGAAGHLYSTQVMMEERTSSGVLVSKSAVDFLIRLVAGRPPVIVAPPTPAANATIPATVGSPVTFQVQASDPDVTNTVSLFHLGLPAGASLTCPAAANPITCAFAWTPTAAQAGVALVSFRAQDSTGLNSTPHPIRIDVAANQPPVVAAGPDAGGTEGSAIGLTGSASDPDGDPLTSSWSYTALAADPGAACSFADASATSTTITCDDDGTFEATLSSSDGTATASDTVLVTVGNAAPDITIPNSADGILAAVGTTVQVTGAVTDAGANDLADMACSVSWDDGAGPVPAASAPGSCSASRTFSLPGVYTVALTADDGDGGTDTDTILVVVYDPSAGFVTGGGWITSPAGAYQADPTATGRANFGFIAKYKKGASVPEGQTEFQFQAGNLNFHSTAYQWLVVSGPKAQFKGEGTVNGQGGYTFLLTVTDGQQPGGGGVDQLRMKITGPGGLVYDNTVGAPDDLDTAAPQSIGGGSIVIHKR